MKKYSLLCIGLFFFISPLSWSMDYDQDEGEYDQSNDENLDESMQDTMQNDMVMQQQPNTMYQNNMMMNQGMMQNSMQMPMQDTMQNSMIMQQQPNATFSNDMMANQMYAPEGVQQEDETSKKEYVQSLVNNILQVNNRQRNQSSQNKTKNGGIVIDRNLKNKLFKLQKDLDEISRSLNGISKAKEATNEKSSTKFKSRSSLAEKKSSERAKFTSNKAKLSKKSKSAKSRIYRGKRTLNKKYSKFNRQKSFYTVKQLTPKNAIKYMPRFYYSGYNRAGNYQSDVQIRNMSYKIKNWGTGEVTSTESYYRPKSYFSDKSKCTNGCGI